ncbi:MAG: LapA family protein [Pseudomonadota bacterium]
MRALGWLVIGLPLMMVIVLFAISNREPVTLSIWPLAAERQAPLYLVILIVAVAGFIVGAVFTWVLGLGARLQAARDRRKLAGLNQEQAGWAERGKRDAEDAYRQQEEERYAKAVRGEPTAGARASQTMGSGQGLPAAQGATVPATQ